MKTLQLNLPIEILGVGRTWPETPALTNADLLKESSGITDSKKLEAFSKRIESTYGFHSRHLAHFPGTPFKQTEETSESLGYRAAASATDGKTPSFMILGSTSSVRYSGSQAAGIAGQFRWKTPVLEIKSGCSTSLASLMSAYGMMGLGYDDVLVVAAETLSKVIDPQNRETWLGLADGAAAVWIRKNPERANFVVNKACFSTEGEFVDLFTTPGRLPPNEEDLKQGRYFISGDSAELRKLAKDRYVQMIEAILPDPNQRKKIRWIISHQVNWMLTDEVIQETGLSGERIWSAKKFGNLGGASIIFSLAESIESKRFQSGDQILLMSVGGGLSYACQLWECTTSTG